VVAIWDIRNGIPGLRSLARGAGTRGHTISFLCEPDDFGVIAEPFRPRPTFQNGSASFGDHDADKKRLEGNDLRSDVHRRRDSPACRRKKRPRRAGFAAPTLHQLREKPGGARLELVEKAERDRGRGRASAGMALDPNGSTSRARVLRDDCTLIL
jgi:hypothetical protein